MKKRVVLKESDMGRYGPLTVPLSPLRENQPVRPEVVAKVRAWIEVNCQPCAGLNKKVSSYSWKHIAEYDNHHVLGSRLYLGGEWEGIGEYVAQGEFVAAALGLGYRAVWSSDIHPNARLNMVPKPPLDRALARLAQEREARKQAECKVLELQSRVESLEQVEKAALAWKAAHERFYGSGAEEGGEDLTDVEDDLLIALDASPVACGRPEPEADTAPSERG